MFSAPRQVVTYDFKTSGEPLEGWMLCFQPDLIRDTGLASQIDDYNYFSCRENEALHLSCKEKEIIGGIMRTIEMEIGLNLDVYSRQLIVANVDLLLRYCERFYSRQLFVQ